MSRPRVWLAALLSVALVGTAGAIERPGTLGLDPHPRSVVTATSDGTIASGAAEAEPAEVGGLGQTAQHLREHVERWRAALLAAVGEVARDAVAVAPARDARPRAGERARTPTKRDRKPSTRRRLKLVRTISGGMTPKSIVSAQNGKVFAMNMMYSHTITVFNRRYRRLKVIDDSVNLARFGFEGYRAKVSGAPVEAAVDPRTKRIYVSNYSMYGPGFRHPGFDLCDDSDRIDRSFVYEINTRTLRKTRVFEVGEVPKNLAISPDGRYLLVGNWCSWDISVVDLRKGRETRRIAAGVAPRGIAFSPDGRLAYVTLVGEGRVLVIDMRRFRVIRDIDGVGERPRHLVMSRDGRYLYITVEGKDRKKRVDGHILAYDTRKRRIVARSAPLTEPRTTVMSRDGRSLYVVDYYPGTLVKLRARDLAVLQTEYLGHHPIGLTYDLASDTLWVAGYGGTVWVLKDR